MYVHAIHVLEYSVRKYNIIYISHGFHVNYFQISLNCVAIVKMFSDYQRYDPHTLSNRIVFT